MICSRLTSVCQLLAMFGILAMSFDAGARPRNGAPPPELIASIACDPNVVRRDIQTFLEAVQPGTDSSLSETELQAELARAVGASSLAGLEPSYLFVVDANPPGMALVGTHANMKELLAKVAPASGVVRGKWVAIGSRPILDRIADYALDVAVGQRRPTVLTMTLYASQVMARHRAEIVALRDRWVAKAVGPTFGVSTPAMAYIDWLFDLLEETSKLKVELHIKPQLVALDVALEPRLRSRFAQFVAAQRPTDYALLERLPATPAPIRFGGRIAMGPYAADSCSSGKGGAALIRRTHAACEALTRVVTGDLAMMMSMPPVVGVVALFGLSDTAVADKAIADMLDALKDGSTTSVNGRLTTSKTNLVATAHDGVQLRSIDLTFDVSNLPGALRHVPDGLYSSSKGTRLQLATFDRLGLMSLIENRAGIAEHTIDAARGKSPRYVAPAVVRDLLVTSRKRKDSFALILDLTLDSQPPADSPFSGFIVATFGVSDNNAQLRIELPLRPPKSASRR